MRYKIMAQILPDVAANLTALRSRITTAVEACERHGSTSNEPCLVAVSKTKPLTLIRKAYDAGQRHFGENYMKELITKSNSPDLAECCPDIRWHYVGAFQKKMASNLTKVVNLHTLETLAGTAEADAVDKRWKGRAHPLRVLVQVNTSGEESKSGVTMDECVRVAAHVHRNCANLTLGGLMTIGSRGHDYAAGPNPDFERLAEARRRVCAELGLDAAQLDLSMGMSGDFEHAIAAGSTIIRVGSTIFGERDYPQT